MIGERSQLAGGNSHRTRQVECGHSDAKHEARGMCSPCYTRWRYKDDRERLIAVARAGNLKSQFGITQADYNRMYKDQAGLCAICNRPCKSGRLLSVDHDHVTGRVRGLLCMKCNNGLGAFDDSPNLLAKAMNYLMR